MMHFLNIAFNNCCMKINFQFEILKKKLLLSFVCIIILILTNDLRSLAQWSAIDPGKYDTTWWNRAPVRLIQTNLREIDALMR